MGRGGVDWGVVRDRVGERGGVGRVWVWAGAGCE